MSSENPKPKSQTQAKSKAKTSTWKRNSAWVNKTNPLFTPRPYKEHDTQGWACMGLIGLAQEIAGRGLPRPAQLIEEALLGGWGKKATPSHLSPGEALAERIVNRLGAILDKADKTNMTYGQLWDWAAANKGLEELAQHAPRHTSSFDFEYRRLATLWAFLTFKPSPSPTSSHKS